MRAIERFILAVFALSSAATFPACSFPSLGSAGRHEILVVLPPAPPSWKTLPELRMMLAWRGPGGRRLSALAQPGASLRIEVDRGRPQAVLVQPSSAGRPLRPAGALYPEALAGGLEDELSLDWLGGYASSVALALEGGGADPWGYDLYRLASEAYRRCADPWLLPPLEAAASLARLEFRIDSFKQPRRTRVALPGPGPWSPESPFAAAPEALPGGGSVASLPEGLWRFLGAREELLASVDGEGVAAFLIR